MVQYNIAILGGPLVTHVNVVFSMWEVIRNSSVDLVDRRVRVEGFSACVVLRPCGNTEAGPIYRGTITHVTGQDRVTLQ